MPIEESPDQDLESVRKSAKFVSDTAFRLLRVNFIIIGIYLTVGGYVSSFDKELRQAIATSDYLAAAIVLLLMSLFAGFIAYESAGRLAAINLYDNPREEYEKYRSTERLVFNVRYAVALSLLSVLSFAVGIVDGIVPSGISLAYLGQFGYTLLVITVLPIIAVHFGVRIIQQTRIFFDSL